MYLDTLHVKHTLSLVLTSKVEKNNQVIAMREAYLERLDEQFMLKQ